LNAGGFRVMVSLDVFNREYEEEDPLESLATRIGKTQGPVRQGVAEVQ
jgi:hypothetical protein